MRIKKSQKGLSMKINITYCNIDCVLYAKESESYIDGEPPVERGRCWKAGLSSEKYFQVTNRSE
jgi:hypothetical protein